MVVKVAFDESWYGVTGVGRYSYELARRLKTSPEFQVKGFSHPNPASPLAPIKLTSELLNYADSQIFWSPQYMLPISAKQRVAITVHDLLQFHHSTKLKSVYFKYILRNLYRRADKILTVSHAMKHELTDWIGCKSEDIVVISNGLSAEFTLSGDELSLDAPYFLYVGNRRRHKNLNRIIQAFSISQAHTESVLALTGDEDQNLKDIARKFGVEDRIRLLGSPDNVELAKIYRGAVATLYVSLYEGFGLPIIESMACGTPVIVTNAGATAETAGNAALLVDPQNIEEIACAFDKMFERDEAYQALRRSGIKRSQFFSWDRSFDELSAVLKSLA